MKRRKRHQLDRTYELWYWHSGDLTHLTWMSQSLSKDTKSNRIIESAGNLVGHKLVDSSIPVIAVF